MNAAPHPCAYPRCPRLVTTAYCVEHRRAAEGGRPSSPKRLYGKRWHRRAHNFRRQFPLCGMRPRGLAPVMSQCFDEGRTTPGFQTDHVVPHRGDLRLFWDELGNWQTLCAACGARKTAAGL